jgi:class 3 adenylate cyclase
LGLVGFQGRTDYTANGGAVNIAARLCDRAADGQILMSQCAYVEIEPMVEAEPLGALRAEGRAERGRDYEVQVFKDEA